MSLLYNFQTNKDKNIVTILLIVASVVVTGGLIAYAGGYIEVLTGTTSIVPVDLAITKIGANAQMDMYTHAHKFVPVYSS